MEPESDGRDVVSYSQVEISDAEGFYPEPVEVDAGLDYQAGGLYDDSAAVLDDDPDGAGDPTPLDVPVTAELEIPVVGVAVAEVVVVDVAGVDEGVTEELDIDGSLLDSIEQELADVERALALLDEGTYGQCEACNHAIDDAVLARTPTARFCAEHLPLSLR